MEVFQFKSIGIIHTPHTEPELTPIQPVFATHIQGTVTVDEEYVDGLLDLNKFSHIYLLYVFHEAHETNLRISPYLQDTPHGVFSTRHVCRPNKIGFSVVRLLSIEGATLQVEDVDMLDGTPLLDIKPFIKRFDVREDVQSGWQDEVSDEVADKRGLRGYSEDHE